MGSDTNGHWRGSFSGTSYTYNGGCLNQGTTTSTADVYGQECGQDYCCGNGVDTECNHVGEWYSPTCTCVLSPIIVDLGGRGFDLTDAQHGVIFDLAARGNAEPLAWTAKGVNNAFLALDRNGNGAVDDGSELFGSATPQPEPLAPNRVNGYAALAVFDVNGDGQITKADPVYYDLLLWTDSNHNGTTEPGELQSLSDAHIASISLNYRESRRSDSAGNMFRYRSIVTFDDSRGGQQRWAYDVFLMGLSGRVNGGR